MSRALFSCIHYRIFMYHYVFYFLIPLLDGVVYALGDGVRVEKTYRAVNADLGVDIYLAAESAGLQLIHAPYAVLLRDEAPQRSLVFRTACRVEHLVDGVLENVVRHLEDAQAYRHAGNPAP